MWSSKAPKDDELSGKRDWYSEVLDGDELDTKDRVVAREQGRQD